jgi:cyclase
MDRDGTYDGYDLELLRAIKARVTVPVIASGGAGSVADCVAAFDEADADAVLAASIFHRDEITLTSLKAGLAAAGIAVRL